MIFIISAERKELSKTTNQLRSNMLNTLLKTSKLNPRVAFGRYQGIDETSYLIEAGPETIDEVRSKLLDLAKHFDQECILEHDDSLGTYLRTPNNMILARLTKLSDNYTPNRPNEDHTAIPSGKFFRVLKFGAFKLDKAS